MASSMNTDGLAVIADFFTGDSKEKALNQAAHKTLLVLLHETPL